MIGLRIKYHRERLNISQEHMAASIGVNQSSYSRIERGSIDIKFSTLEAIVKALGMPAVEDLFCSEHPTFNLSHNKNASGITFHQSPDYRDEYIQTLKEQLGLLNRIIEEKLNNNQKRKKR